MQNILAAHYRLPNTLYIRHTTSEVSPKPHTDNVAVPRNPVRCSGKPLPSSIKSPTRKGRDEQPHYGISIRMTTCGQTNHSLIEVLRYYITLSAQKGSTDHSNTIPCQLLHKTSIFQR